jgi:hypothetical protein
MASLAALEVSKALEAGQLGTPPSRCQIQCYTYGAPRTGNHAFAREYLQCVPHTWQIVNGEAGQGRAGAKARGRAGAGSQAEPHSLRKEGQICVHIRALRCAWQATRGLCCLQTRVHQPAAAEKHSGCL